MNPQNMSDEKIIRLLDILVNGEVVVYSFGLYFENSIYTPENISSIVQEAALRNIFPGKVISKLLMLPCILLNLESWDYISFPSNGRIFHVLMSIYQSTIDPYSEEYLSRRAALSEFFQDRGISLEIIEKYILYTADILCTAA